MTSSGATVHGFPVIRTDQPSRFGTQVIRGSADKKLCVVRDQRLEDNSGINNIIKYRSEIQFMLCFIWRSVNPIERKPEPDVFMFGCSLFARFAVSTVGLEPSEKTTTNPPCNEQ